MALGRKRLLELALARLQVEKKRIEEEIVEVQAELEGARLSPKGNTPARKKAARRRMSAEQRKALSERMKKVWAERRKKESK